MSGIDLSDVSRENSARGSALIPFAARQALHNMPAFYNKEVAIDLIEYPGLDHIGVRVYHDQIASMTVEDRVKVFEKIQMMIEILKSYGVSASAEKVPGRPPAHAK